MNRLIITFTFLCSFVKIINAQDCNMTAMSYHSGEKLVYNIGYYLWPLWVSAGEVSFEVKDSIMDSVDYYHFFAEGHTFKAYDLIFKVRDKYESLVNKETMKPAWFKRDVLEGSTKIDNEVTFDFDSLTAQTFNGKFSSSACAFDVVSAIYYCRDLNWESFSEQDTIPLDLFLDDSLHHVYVRYLGREVIKTKAGKFNTIKFAPLLIEGTLFSAGEGMTVWVTDDENKIPILVESPIIVGSVRAEIVGLEGTKNDLSSKILRK